MGAAQSAIEQNPQQQQRQPQKNRQQLPQQQRRPLPSNGQQQRRGAPANGQIRAAAVAAAPASVPRPMAFHANVPVGPYLMVRVPAIYAPQFFYCAQQGGQPVYVSYPQQGYGPQPLVYGPQTAAGYGGQFTAGVMMVQNNQAVAKGPEQFVYPYVMPQPVVQQPVMAQPPPYPGNRQPQPSPVVVPVNPEPTPHPLVNLTPIPFPASERPLPIKLVQPKRSDLTPAVPLSRLRSLSVGPKVANKKVQTPYSIIYDSAEENSDDTDTDSDSDNDRESDSEVEYPPRSYVPLPVSIANRPPVEVTQEDDDLAMAIQLEGILNEDEDDEPQRQRQDPVQPSANQTKYSLLLNPQDNSARLEKKPDAVSEEELLTVNEIVHLYKYGEPVGDYVNFYIALHPEQAQQLEELLYNESLTQSKITDIQEFYKKMVEKKKPTDDPFTIDYFESEDYDEDFNYDD